MVWTSREALPFRFRPRSPLLNIPTGSFLGFLAGPLSEGENVEQGYVLAHAMVYIGAGRAVGSNNMVIGGDPDWSVMDLTTLPWVTGGAQASFKQGPRTFIIRYRNIEDTQRRDCIIM